MHMLAVGSEAGGSELPWKENDLPGSGQTCSL